MAQVVDQREAARRDLIAHFVQLAERAGIDVAERFLGSAQTSFDQLARQPTIGSLLGSRHPELAKIRKWRVKGFDNHLIFDEPQAEGVTIVRVLHATRDWWQMLGVDGSSRPD